MNETGVAILGYGVVGKGAAHAVRENGLQIEKRTGVKLKLLHVLDLLDFPDSPEAGIITHDVRDVLDDENVGVVIETMGGLKTAYEYTRAALVKRKNVVTSNKELVAEYGPELLALAKANGTSYRFDASVGGGIPVIAPITECLAANNIVGITGILNGTTNFMLSHMRARGTQFYDTLAMAREKGYAEGDPSADIEGTDACRKLAILSSVAWGSYVDWKTIHTVGISQITAGDIANAVDLGRVIKLVARSRRLGDGRIEAFVLPVMLDRRDPLAGVDGVYNAVILHCDLNGDIMLYGQGAGMIPTGGAVIADVVKAAAGAGGYPAAYPDWDRSAALGVSGFDSYEHGYYARAATPDPCAYADFLFREFPEARVLPARGDVNDSAEIPAETPSEAGETVAFTAPSCTEGEFARKLTRINENVKGSATATIARIL